MPRSSTRRTQANVWWVHVMLAVGGFIMVLPFLYQLLASFMSNAQMLTVPTTLWPTEWNFDNFVKVFERLPFAAQLGNSVLFAAIRTVAHVVFCTLAGYAFARMRFRGSGILFGLFLSVLMVPSGLLLIPQYEIIVGLGWINTVQGVVAPNLVSVFGTFLMRQFFLAMPKDLEDAARLDGAGPARIFAQIMLPLAKPGISALAVIEVIQAWGDLLWPLVVTTHNDRMPIAVGLATLQGDPNVDYPVLLAASLMAVLPVIIVFLIMQRRVVEGLAQSGLKG